VERGVREAATRSRGEGGPSLDLAPLFGRLTTAIEGLAAHAADSDDHHRELLEVVRCLAEQVDRHIAAGHQATLPSDSASDPEPRRFWRW
jgi:hypothetical protein